MHTPGPWTVRPATVGSPSDRVYHDDNEVAFCPPSESALRGTVLTGAEAEDNARLIAAAPKLLEALEELVVEYGIDVSSVKLLTDRCRSVWGQAGAAIAEAKGE